MFLLSFGVVLFELLLTRIFGVVLFASFAHLALALALLGISAGALVQHLWPHLLPDEALERRLAWLALLQGGSTVAAVMAAVAMPLTRQSSDAPERFAERSSIAWNLVDPLWFSALMPLLTVPFAVAGLAFAGTFQRRRAHIGLLYGADLLGGATAAVAFVPLLVVFSAPDAALVVATSSGIAAALLQRALGGRGPAVAAGLFAVVPLLTLVGGALGGVELIRVRYAAGYSESNVTHVQWTPLTRLAVHEGDRGTFLLLDNTSASEVVRDEVRRAELALEPNRGLVYRLHDPPARVAILAASAGPEVAVAQQLGFSEIDAIDIAPEIGDLVATRFAADPVNPFRQPGVRRVLLDGRAAILHADRPYDIIQMVHANLHSSAGQLANAWSPALLETKEAFHTYFDELSPDGTLSFGKGSETPKLLRTVAAALRERGVEHPERHILLVRGNATVMLVKRRPFTAAERDRVRRWIDTLPGQFVELDPLLPDPARVASYLDRGVVLTDDRPYLEDRDRMLGWLIEAARTIAIGSDDGEVPPFMVVWLTLVLQIALTVAAGAGLLVVPALRRAPTGLVGLDGVGWGLLYAACLGYGYLGVETVLVHELVLFVGHPTYAITVVVLAMLLSSGVGSTWAQRVEPEDLVRALRLGLGAVVALGALQAYVVPELLHALFLGAPIAVRVGLVAVVLAPLGFVMGLPWPLALRALRPEAEGIVPWAWALNGWTSVLASLGTVMISRTLGYGAAHAAALAAYAVALALAPRLARIGAGDMRHSLPKAPHARTVPGEHA